MRARSIFRKGIEYADFESPYTGLAAMIFVQMEQDIQALDGREQVSVNKTLLSRTEILNFLRSDWGKFLAESVGIERVEINRYIRELGA